MERENNHSEDVIHLWGPVSAPDDMNRTFPPNAPELELGDWVYLENVGAYSMAMWAPFNGIPKPKIYYYVREEMRYIITTINHYRFSQH